MLQRLVCCLVLVQLSLFASPQPDLAWTGGPLHTECENNPEFLSNHGQHVKDNVIAIKAVTYKDEIYVLTPRLKSGVLATLWTVQRGRKGAELHPFPEVRAHRLADCRALQNAVDFHLDHFSPESCDHSVQQYTSLVGGCVTHMPSSLWRIQPPGESTEACTYTCEMIIGNLWILDSGIVETLTAPRCTCPPKVVVISLLLDKLTRHIDLSSVVEPSSLLQSIVVEYELTGKAFVFVSDASRGAILVHDVSADEDWAVLSATAAAALQLAIIKRRSAHSVLVAVRIPHAGLIEMDTAALKRQHSTIPLTVFGEHDEQLILLGSDSRHVFIRRSSRADVLAWNVRDAFNASRLQTVHSPAPRLVPTSVASEPLRHTILVLDSNYGETVNTYLPTYHRLTFINKL